MFAQVQNSSVENHCEYHVWIFRRSGLAQIFNSWNGQLVSSRMYKLLETEEISSVFVTNTVVVIGTNQGHCIVQTN